MNPFNSFGITGEDGKLLPHIKRAFLQVRELSLRTLATSGIRRHKGGEYYLPLLDQETFFFLDNVDKWPCAISFQETTAGNFAVIRLRIPPEAQAKEKEKERKGKGNEKE